MDTIIAFALGAFIGGSFGVIVTAVMVAGRDDK